MKIEEDGTMSTGELLQLGGEVKHWTDGTVFRVLAVLHAEQWRRLTEAQEAVRLHEADYKRGIKEGLRLFAWWKDGVEYVGTCGVTLDGALKAVDRGELP